MKTISIRKARLDKGLTQQQLAARVGVDQSQVSRWESRETFPSVTSLKRLDRVLFTSKR